MRKFQRAGLILSLTFLFVGCGVSNNGIAYKTKSITSTLTESSFSSQLTGTWLDEVGCNEKTKTCQQFELSEKEFSRKLIDFVQNMTVVSSGKVVEVNELSEEIVSSINPTEKKGLRFKVVFSSFTMVYPEKIDALELKKLPTVPEVCEITQVEDNVISLDIKTCFGATETSLIAENDYAIIGNKLYRYDQQLDAVTSLYAPTTILDNVVATKVND